MVDTEVQACRDRDQDDDGADDLGDPSRAPRHHEDVDDTDDSRGDDEGRCRGQREAVPPADDRDVVGARPLVRLEQDETDDLGDHDAADEREQVPPSLEDDRCDQEEQADGEPDPPGGHPVDGTGNGRQPPGAQLGDRTKDGRVDLVGHPPGPGRQQGHARPQPEHGEGDDPPPAGPADAAREGRCRTRRAAPATLGPHRGRDPALRRLDGRCRGWPAAIERIDDVTTRPPPATPTRSPRRRRPAPQPPG